MVPAPPGGGEREQALWQSVEAEAGREVAPEDDQRGFQSVLSGLLSQPRACSLGGKVLWSESSCVFPSVLYFGLHATKHELPLLTLGLKSLTSVPSQIKPSLTPLRGDHAKQLPKSQEP